MQKKRIKVQVSAPREWYVLKNRLDFLFSFLFSCCIVNSVFHSFLSSSRGITLLTVLPLLLLSLLKIIITCQPVETRSHWRQVWTEIWTYRSLRGYLRVSRSEPLIFSVLRARLSTEESPSRWGQSHIRGLLCRFQASAKEEDLSLQTSSWSVWKQRPGFGCSAGVSGDCSYTTTEAAAGIQREL